MSKWNVMAEEDAKRQGNLIQPYRNFESATYSCLSRSKTYIFFLFQVPTNNALFNIERENIHNANKTVERRIFSYKRPSNSFGSQPKPFKLVQILPSFINQLKVCDWIMDMLAPNVEAFKSPLLFLSSPALVKSISGQRQTNSYQCQKLKQGFFSPDMCSAADLAAFQ